MAQILAIKVLGYRTVQMQPRVSQSTACVAPDQNSAAVQMKPRVRRLAPASHRIKTPQRCRWSHVAADQRLSRTG